MTIQLRTFQEVESDFDANPNAPIQIIDKNGKIQSILSCKNDAFSESKIDGSDSYTVLPKAVENTYYLKLDDRFASVDSAGGFTAGPITLISRAVVTFKPNKDGTYNFKFAEKGKFKITSATRLDCKELVSKSDGMVFSFQGL
jgi:hypothetical protein